MQGRALTRVILGLEVLNDKYSKSLIKRKSRRPPFGQGDFFLGLHAPACRQVLVTRKWSASTELLKNLTNDHRSFCPQSILVAISCGAIFLSSLQSWV
ncbi:hypothetical protein K439DRAFT_477483 [Ramaria rubella]|nr:hypothetical protein K439DRAFT_477483 [Ramaria rubella]